MKVAVIGQGYVGLPLAMQAVRSGYDVVGFDTDRAKVESLADGRSPIEDVDNAELVKALETGRYLPTRFTEDLRRFDIAVITVPTPLDSRGRPDLSYVIAAAETVGTRLKEGALVILESTVAPGTTEEIVRPHLEKFSGLLAGSQFSLGFSPERIDPGNKQWNFTNTPKVVSGVDEHSLLDVESFYRSMGLHVMKARTIAAAELAKLIENSYRDLNIAFVNELSRYAHSAGIDLRNALDVAGTKPFGFTAFQPGPGVGGHCLPIDPVYLTEHSLGHGVPLQLLDTARRVNSSQPDYVVHRLDTGLRTVRRRSDGLDGAQVAVLGYAYKKGTADCRETPARRIVELLLESGATVTVYEPHADLSHLPKELGGYSRLQTVRDAPNSSQVVVPDAIVIVTDHDEFDYRSVAEYGSFVLDTRNRLAASRSQRIEII